MPPASAASLPNAYAPVVCGSGLADHSDGFARDSHPLPSPLVSQMHSITVKCECQCFSYRRQIRLLWRSGETGTLYMENGRSSLPFLEQGTGIEPASSAWEADVLPMYYICVHHTYLILLLFLFKSTCKSCRTLLKLMIFSKEITGNIKKVPNELNNNFKKANLDTILIISLIPQGVIYQPSETN